MISGFGLDGLVRQLLKRNAEKRVPLNVNIVDFRRTPSELELGHNADVKYGPFFVFEYPFLIHPFSIAAKEISAQGIGQKLNDGESGRFEGEIILAWDRLFSLIEGPRAGLQGRLIVGSDEYDARFNVETYPGIPPVYHIQAVQISKIP